MTRIDYLWGGGIDNSDRLLPRMEGDNFLHCGSAGVSLAATSNFHRSILLWHDSGGCNEFRDVVKQSVGLGSGQHRLPTKSGRLEKTERNSAQCIQEVESASLVNGRPHERGLMLYQLCYSLGTYVRYRREPVARSVRTGMRFRIMKHCIGLRSWRSIIEESQSTCSSCST